MSTKSKSKTNPAPAEAPAPAVPAKPKPAFVAHQARTVEPPKRHEGTARTVRYVIAGDGEAHLFSYAGDFIATVSVAEGEALAPSTKPAKPAEPAEPAEEAPATPES